MVYAKVCEYMLCYTDIPEDSWMPYMKPVY